MLLQASNVFVSASCGAAALQALAPAATLGLQRLLPLSAARRAPAASHGPRAAAWAPPPAYAAFAARQASSNATPSGPARPFSSEAQPSAMPALAAAPALALPPRIKGIGRKMLLRQINRSIIRRLARRLTIGIPILGLYFVTRILRSDAAALAGHLRAGDGPLAALYAAAVASEVVDVVAQSLITVGMGISSGLLTLPAGLAALPAGLAAGFGFAALPALPAAIVIADKISIGSAALSCSAGLAAEAVKARRGADAASSGDEASAGESDSDDGGRRA